MSHIGDAVSRALTLHEMTAKHLAEEAGFSEQYISDIRSGRRLPPVETARGICNVFPDEDSVAWSWDLLRDVWGDPVVDVMRDWAVKMATIDQRRHSADGGEGT